LTQVEKPTSVPAGKDGKLDMKIDEVPDTATNTLTEVEKPTSVPAGKDGKLEMKMEITKKCNFLLAFKKPNNIKMFLFSRHETTNKTGQ
jgi:hypothetical protein